jgi:hypothetical protein
MSRGSSYRNDTPREPFSNQGPGPRNNNGPGLPVRQPTGPGLNNHGFSDRDRRRDMDVSHFPKLELGFGVDGKIATFSTCS